MLGYWARKRLLLSSIFCVGLAIISSILFIFPAIEKQANIYNSQSVYHNSRMDFIAPEPSFSQIDELENAYGIDKTFPFFLTKTAVHVNGISRTTTVLLSDRFENVEITMYNPERMILESKTKYDNPIYVDWLFYKATSAKIGDIVTINICGVDYDYSIQAVYETNTIYDGGAILVSLTSAQAEAIREQSGNNGYSGMYISSSDYDTCKAFLTNDYRPLGRLKAREQFETDDQYEIHYNAIMSSGYANEITDCRIKEMAYDQKALPVSVYLGSILAFVFVIIFNVLMKNRGCERVYFSRQCIPRGQNVKPYYVLSVFYEILAYVGLYSVILLISIYLSSVYIPSKIIDIKAFLVPCCFILAELIAFIGNVISITKSGRGNK